MSKLINISELAKMLGLVDSKNGKPLNYILRYWEKEFKQLKPRIINKRRYYSPDQIEMCKLIQFLTKSKKMTIKGAKNVLNLNINKLDDYNFNSLKADYHRGNVKEKSRKILEKIKRLKRYGKKNARKSKISP